MTRTLKSHELHLLHEGAVIFHREAGMPGKFCAGAFDSFWKKLLDAGVGEVLATFEGDIFVGALGYTISRCPYTGDMVALEQFFWVSPEHRKSGAGAYLWGQFEGRAAGAGAKRIAMIHLAFLNLQKVYEARGYKLCEQTFWKEV